MQQIAFGGGCHWCTEAVYLSLKGVSAVTQGFVASEGEQSEFSEAVIVDYSEEEISLKDLIEIHLYTHSCTANHSMREKYRSAIYTFNENDAGLANGVLQDLQVLFNDAIITKVYPFKEFKPSEKMFQNYYFDNPEKPFCKTYIAPKLKVLLQKFSKNVDARRLDDVME